MPTARPSIRASEGVIVLRSLNTVNATAPARPTPTPSSATSSGRPAAMRLPSVMTSTTSATVRPSTSPGPTSEVSWVISTL